MSFKNSSCLAFDSIPFHFKYGLIFVVSWNEI